MCTVFRNSQKREALPSDFGCFAASTNEFDIFRQCTARTARFGKKSLGSDVGEIKKMSEKFKKQVGVYTAKCPRKIEHGDLL
jgi:hypothetical protein